MRGNIRKLRVLCGAGRKSTTGIVGKRIAAGKGRRFNRRKYAAMLAESTPRVIDTPEELERASRLVEPLLARRRRTPEEKIFLTLMLKLIDDYQASHPAFPPMKPHELLQALMEEQKLRQADLLDIFGTRSRVSDAVRGKRGISKEQAKKLGQRFSLSPSAFI